MAQGNYGYLLKVPYGTHDTKYNRWAKCRMFSIKPGGTFNSEWAFTKDRV